MAEMYDFSDGLINVALAKLWRGISVKLTGFNCRWINLTIA